MKRIHVHVSVENLDDSIRFYSALFNAQPAVANADYAKWMLDDPCINFAISQRGRRVGVDHFGIQVESDEELAEMDTRLDEAALPKVVQPGSTCCYAQSDKYWTMDPQGIVWETFRTLHTIPTFGEPMTNLVQDANGACCAPTASIIAFRSGT